MLFIAYSEGSEIPVSQFLNTFSSFPGPDISSAGLAVPECFSPVFLTIPATSHCWFPFFPEVTCNRKSILEMGNESRRQGDTSFPFPGWFLLFYRPRYFLCWLCISKILFPWIILLKQPTYPLCLIRMTNICVSGLTESSGTSFGQH